MPRTVVQSGSRQSKVGGTSAPRPGLMAQSGAPPPRRATGSSGSKTMSLRVPMTVWSPGSRLTPMLT
ncbi:MAG: hypothetical protein U0802_00475 [Candidatus Binatia bacterium]